MALHGDTIVDKWISDAALSRCGFLRPTKRNSRCCRGYLKDPGLFWYFPQQCLSHAASCQVGSGTTARKTWRRSLGGPGRDGAGHTAKPGLRLAGRFATTGRALCQHLAGDRLCLVGQQHGAVGRAGGHYRHHDLCCPESARCAGVARVHRTGRRPVAGFRRHAAGLRGNASGFSFAVAEPAGDQRFHFRFGRIDHRQPDEAPPGAIAERGQCLATACRSASPAPRQPLADAGDRHGGAADTGLRPRRADRGACPIGGQYRQGDVDHSPDAVAGCPAGDRGGDCS
jgi:hypothetical protein